MTALLELVRFAKDEQHSGVLFMESCMLIKWGPHLDILLFVWDLTHF